MSFSEKEFYSALKTDGIRLEHHILLESTNITCKQRGLEGYPEGYTVISDSQSSGYGRYRRAFFSPPDTGLYMSILLRPSVNPDSSLLITTAAAASVCMALEAMTGKSFGIKWVNDIYLADKKVCGILTEGVYSGDGISYAVLGIGVNIKSPSGGFPSCISDIAASVEGCGGKISKELLSAEIINRFFTYYKKITSRPHYDYYKNKLMYIGKTVKIISSYDTYTARLLDLNSDFSLNVEDENSNIKKIFSGEVSVKDI